MPTVSELSEQPNQIDQAITKRQEALTSLLSTSERELYFALLAALVEKISFGNDGRAKYSAKNLALVSNVDTVFDTWAINAGRDTVAEFVRDLLAVSGMTGMMYEEQAAERAIREITEDNRLLFAALGVTPEGEAKKGALMWEIWQANQVRQQTKNVLLGALKSRATAAEVTKAVREFMVGTGDGGGLTMFWRTYAYDLFNQVAEIKNEQFRAALDLHWFIYTGDVIRNTRAFCRPKAGKVFADVEADTEWPKDPTLIGKTSGIPYTPRIDRGRWNCRHRIRYITRELAVQLDPKKVKRIEEKYGQG